MVGSSVSVMVGSMVGSCVSAIVGFMVGSSVSMMVGSSVAGGAVGSTVGSFVFGRVGSLVSVMVGFSVASTGKTVGVDVDGLKVGSSVIAAEGADDGARDGEALSDGSGLCISGETEGVVLIDGATVGAVVGGTGKVGACDTEGSALGDCVGAADGDREGAAVAAAGQKLTGGGPSSVWGETNARMRYLLDKKSNANPLESLLTKVIHPKFIPSTNKGYTPSQLLLKTTVDL